MPYLIRSIDVRIKLGWCINYRKNKGGELKLLCAAKLQALHLPPGNLRRVPLKKCACEETVAAAAAATLPDLKPRSPYGAIGGDVCLLLSTESLIWP